MPPFFIHDIQYAKVFGNVTKNLLFKGGRICATITGSILILKGEVI
jgi:hypothetical protein